MGTQFPFPPKGHSSPPLFGPCLLWPNGRPSQILLSTCFVIFMSILVLMWCWTINATSPLKCSCCCLQWTLTISPLMGAGSEVLRWACLYVRMSLRLHIPKTTHQNFRKFSVRVVRGCDLVCFWWQWNMLCTSDFVNGIMFSHNEPYGAWRWPYQSDGHSRDPRTLVINFQRICHVWHTVRFCRCTQWQQLAHQGY